MPIKNTILIAKFGVISQITRIQKLENIKNASYIICMGINGFHWNPNELFQNEPKVQHQDSKKESSKIYIFSLLVVALGSFGIIFFLGKQLKSLVDLATTMSFLIAPVIAIVNYQLVTGNHLKKEDQPKSWLRILSWLGIVFLTGFAVYYVKIRFFN